MGFLEDRDLTAVPTIPEFYKGKTIFITGGSGFMGKVLIEKLLYSCSDLDRIYLLIRKKKGVKSEERLEQMYSSPCFDRLKNEKPTVFPTKVFVVAGDVMEPGLGLSDEDRALLIHNVNIVFHVAASVRFDDPLPFAVKMNLRGTVEMVELAKDMRNLFAFVHVSTAYSNTNRNPIDEIMYPPHADVRDTLEVCETLDEHTIKVFTPKYLGEVPNTYAFSKQLAEHVMYENRGHIPGVIIRPSIVISSVAEPMPGWIENFNGPVGLLVASGKGIMRTCYTDPDLIADYMPVDISIKSMIVAGWLRGTKSFEPTDDIAIYNSCAGNLNNITMGGVVSLGLELYPYMPLNDMLWYVGGDLTTSKTIHYIKVLFLHLLPALLIDTLLWILGRKPMLIKIQRRIFIANQALEYYITQQWTFANNNLIKLRSCVKPEDLKHFYYEMENVDKYQFFYNSIKGAKKYLLKEKEEDLPRAKAHFKRMQILDAVVRIVFWVLVFWSIFNLSFVKNILSSVFSLL